MSDGAFGVFVAISCVAWIGMTLGFLLSPGSRREAPPDDPDPPAKLPTATALERKEDR